MTWIRAQVVLHTVNNVSEDFVTNSWCIECTDVPGASEFTEITTCFKDFYDDLSGILGEPITNNGHEVKYYDLEWTTPPNYPLATNTFNLASSPTGNPLPSEVAICLSFQGTKVPGFPQNRRRGRVYIGPINQNMNSAGRPSSTALSTLGAAAVTLCTNLKACSEPALLSVWSPTDSDGVRVADGWIDNSFDTQRRRGINRTSRTTWVAP